MTNEPQIPKYYANKKILITGATGLLGKVILWKLLKSCPEIDTIFVLIRSKRAKNAAIRREELFRSVIFEDLKKYNPGALEKVIFMTGDVGKDGIGLLNYDRDLLVNEISVIFHVAAILKMNASLKSVINVNTMGTLRMLCLAEQMKQLQAIVYVSTAYCCCENELVEEKLYPAKHNPYDVIRLTQWMDPKILEIITPKLIEPLPNTYTYSKRLTESLLSDFQSKVPIIVARPTIVIPALREPIPGWIDNMNGPIGLFVAAGTGLLRATTLQMERKSNKIPVDIAVNGILALPWANRRESLLMEIPVYNIGEADHESKSWEEFAYYAIIGNEKYPFENILWYPVRKVTAENILEYKIKSILLHWIPAYIIDSIIRIIGQKPFLVRTFHKIQQGEDVFRYFTRGEWSFVNRNMLRINEQMNEADKEIFPNTIKELVDLQEYLDQIILVIRSHLLKQNPDSLEFSRKKLRIMYYVDKVMVFLRYILFFKILLFFLNIIVQRVEAYQNIERY